MIRSKFLRIFEYSNIGNCATELAREFRNFNFTELRIYRITELRLLLCKNIYFHKLFVKVQLYPRKCRNS